VVQTGGLLIDKRSIVMYRALGRKREENLAFGSQYLQNTYGGGYFVNKGLDTLYRLLLL